MSNSYATVPAIIPGDLQVQGNLTVAGQRFTFGRFPRRYRIQEIGNGQFVETVNLDKLAVLQDDPTSTSVERVMFPATNPFQVGTQAPGTPATDTWIVVSTPGEFVVATPSLRVGAATPYVRLINSPGSAGMWSVNVQADGATRDDTTKPGYLSNYVVTNRQASTWTIDAAGNSIQADPPRVFWLDHAYRSVQGPIGQQNVISKTIYGNQLGPYGAVYIRLMGSSVTSSTGTAKIGFTFGSGHVDIATFPANTTNNFLFHVWLSNMASTSLQYLWWFGNYNATAVGSANVGLTQDTTLNQTLTYTVNNSDGTTQTVLDGLEAEFFSRAAPI